MRALVVFICTVLVVNGVSVEEEWKAFKENTRKQYRSRLEESKRLQIFQDNLEKIEEHNRKYGLGEVSYQLAINKFADLTQEEFITRLNQPLSTGIDNPVASVDVEDSEAPDEIDWRQRGAVTRVKDQGDCGACWAFGANGALEGQYFMKTGELIPLSEQFMIDCSKGNYGCSGGWTLNAYRFVRDSGMVTEESYPYEAEDKSCRANGTFLRDIGFVNIPQNEDAIKLAVAEIGPVAVSIDASYLSLYGGGVFDNNDCSRTFTNHVVLITGYGTTEDGIDYWDVKNSWGADWGDHGYVKMSRNKNGQCAINTRAFYPLV